MVKNSRASGTGFRDACVCDDHEFTNECCDGNPGCQAQLCTPFLLKTFRGQSHCKSPGKMCEPAGPLPSAGSTRIVTFNIGLRGLKNTVDYFGGSLQGLLAAVGQPDILCLQETKISRAELAKFAETLVRIPDMFAFFGFNRKGTGYSGVATYCKLGAVPLQVGK